MNSFNQKGEIVPLAVIPFRLTPNLVNFVTPVGITGLFSAALVASAQTLDEPEFRVQDYCSVILRDELLAWYATHHEPWLLSGMSNDQLVTSVKHNVDKMLE